MNIELINLTIGMHAQWGSSVMGLGHITDPMLREDLIDAIMKSYEHECPG